MEEKKLDRKQKQAAAMVWNEYVPISMPAGKHLLSMVKHSDLAEGRLVSVVENAVAADAVKEVGLYVRAKGWKSGTNEAGKEFTFEWVEKDKCYKVTYGGNRWMTHVGSGQLWPHSGPDIFSPSLAEEPVPVKVLKTYIGRWKSSKKRPDEYMNMPG